MPLFKYIRDDLTKLSFINRTIFKNAVLSLYYFDKENIERCVKLSYRTTRDRLLTTLESIKKDSGYYEKLEEQKEKINKEVLKRPIAAYIK
jgi:hypothetical protein